VTKNVYLGIGGVAYVVGILSMFVVGHEPFAAAVLAAPGSYVVLPLSDLIPHATRLGVFLGSWAGNVVLLLLSVAVNVAAGGILLRLVSRRR
jgi:hypothetical protein